MGSVNGQDLKPEFAELKAAPQDKRAPILQRLQTSTSLTLLDVAKGMQGMDPVQKNLCLGLAQTILAREPNTSVPLLTTILENKKLDPAIRYWAFTKIAGGNKERREKLLRQMQDDPALSLRFEAIKLGVDELKGLKERNPSMMPSSKRNTKNSWQQQGFRNRFRRSLKNSRSSRSMWTSCSILDSWPIGK